MAKNNKPTMMDALLEMCPSSAFVMRGDTWDTLEWLDATPQPTREEAEAVLARKVAEWDAVEYKRARAAAYPSIEAQLDMQYWDAVNGTTVWADTIAAIKEQFPK
jgi:hypothetical protein